MFKNDLTSPLAPDQKEQNINIHKIHQKRSRSKPITTTFLHNKFPSQRIKQIEQEWSFTIEDLLLKYKGEKLVPKDQITELLNNATEAYTNTFP